MFPVRTLVRAVLLASTLTLAGCSGLIPTAVTPAAITVTGNWQLTSAATAAAKLPMITGELTGTSVAATGILHASGASSCASPTTVFAVTGSADANRLLTLHGSNAAAGNLTVTGTLAADGKSLTNASYQVTGGSCAFATPAAMQAQSFNSITGNYTGSFVDPAGNLISIAAATLNQTPASDTSGNFQLSGSATFPNNPCFSSPVNISASQVTGGTFTLTYADSVTTNSVTATGTFSQDGVTLTVSNWTLTGPCGPDSGTGLLTRQ